MKKSASSAKQQEITPQCLGEMWVHSESVNEILSLSEFEFASCGSDGYIVLWKVRFFFKNIIRQLLNDK